MEENAQQSLVPPPEATVGGAYGHGWQILKKNFLELLLVIFIIMLINAPLSWFNKNVDFISSYGDYDFDFTNGLYSLLYWLLVATPLEYGAYLIFVRASRGTKVQIRDIISPFNQFVEVVLTKILITGIVIIGIFLFIIPGIIFAIKLAFAPYLVVDKKMDAISAIKESWKMTSGHGFTIFVMAILAFIIMLGGFIVFFVGIFISMIWIMAAFASLYYAADSAGKDAAGSQELETSPVEESS